jgi:hypothetical protein
MDWLFEFLADHLFWTSFIGLLVLLAFVDWRNRVEATHRAKYFRGLRETFAVPSDRFPLTYIADVESELLLCLIRHAEQSCSLTELKQLLPNVKESEAQLQHILEQTLCSQGLVSSETGATSQAPENAYKITELGKTHVLREGITPIVVERAEREFYRVRQTLFSKATEDLGASCEPKEICRTSFLCLRKISTGFLESFVRPLAPSRSQIRRTWLAHQLRDCWSSEFLRARTYVIDLCEARQKQFEITPSVYDFDRWAGTLEDQIWNEAVLAILPLHVQENALPDDRAMPENANDPSLLRPMSIPDKALLRDILAEQQRFESPQTRRDMLKFFNPTGLKLPVDLSGPPGVVAERVLNSLLPEPLTRGDPRVNILKNICDDLLVSNDLPLHRMNQLQVLVQSYEYLSEHR